MHWDDLRFVLAVSREKSLSKAAKTLGVTHTTVSRRLAALERETGVRLFDRQPEGYIPTVAGEDLVAAAERMEEEVLALDSRVLGRDARLSGPLRITTIDAMAARMTKPIGDFLTRYPGVSVELSTGTDFRNLTRREADIAIRTTNRPDEHLVGSKVGTVEYAIYGAESLVERVGVDAPLSAFPWLGWELRFGARVTEARMQVRAPKARVAMRFDSAVVFETAVRNGAGIGFISCIEGDAAGLVRLRPIEKNFGMDVWMLTHPDLRSTARVRAFMDEIGGVLRGWRRAWAGIPDEELGLGQS